MNRDYYTVIEVADMLNTNDKYVYEWLHDGTLPGCRVGGRWVIPKKRFERWMKDHEDSV